MVLVPLILGAHAVQHHRKVFLMITGKDVILAAFRKCPASMCLHVGLRDHVQPVEISEAVDDGSVGIVTGPDRVDVIAFHDQDVCDDILPARGSSRVAGELVTVHAVEDDALSVEAHDAV